MAKAIDIANYFLSLQDEEVGDFISNLKLQKLLYYAQGFHLAETGRPLFDDPIAAWQHGPVVADVYHTFKEFGGNALPMLGDIRGIDPTTAQFLDEIYRVYGQFSAWKLSHMTHEEPPWKEARAGDKIISHKSLRDFFATRLENS